MTGGKFGGVLLRLLAEFQGVLGTVLHVCGPVNQIFIKHFLVMRLILAPVEEFKKLFPTIQSNTCAESVNALGMPQDGILTLWGVFEPGST